MKRSFDGSVHSAGIRALLGIALLVTLSSPSVRPEVPEEVTDLAWCPGGMNCTNWAATPGALDYHLYRGGPQDLADLLDGADDACRVGSYTDPTSGPTLEEVPPRGEWYWFLVTAQNADGEGTPGESSVGPRSLDSSGVCGSPGGLLINEVDYDQPGVDAGEFIEIFNAGANDRELSDLQLILVNGGTSTEYRRIDLGDAGPSLPAGGYLVVGAANVVAALPPGTPAIAFGSATNSLQNGAPDGVALFDGGSSQLLDALSYEGAIHAAAFDGVPGTFDLVQGTAATSTDSNSVDGSLGRSPNGGNTGDADTDWRFGAVPSPGSVNPLP